MLKYNFSYFIHAVPRVIAKRKMVTGASSLTSKQRVQVSMCEPVSE